MLEVKNLTAGYGAITAIRDVSLNVKSGEIVAILGANGAGKSTTLKTISGLMRPTAGEVLFEGVPITGIKAHKIARMRITHCPEGRRLFSNLTVKENLEMGAYSRRDKRGIAADYKHALSLFPTLAVRQRQKAGTLSGGEQQMLAVARALMSKPKLLLLDEPSLGLAPLLIEEIFRTLSRIREESGVTILIVEQNARIALSVADRGYVLETGKVVMSAAAETLINDPKIVAAYLGG